MDTRVDRPLSERTPVFCARDEGRLLGERVALFACGLLQSEALDLVDGFSASVRRMARGYAQEVLKLSSADRQGRLASEFGLRPDGVERLRRCLQQVDAPLRKRLLHRLSPGDRAGVGMAPEELPEGSLSPASSVLVDRLIRECTR